MGRRIGASCLDLRPISEAVSCAFFSPDGTTLMIACEDGKVHFFDADGTDRHQEVLVRNEMRPTEKPAIVGVYDHSGTRLSSWTW